jgi:hypothetical protein
VRAPEILKLFVGGPFQLQRDVHALLLVFRPPVGVQRNAGRCRIAD